MLAFVSWEDPTYTEEHLATQMAAIKSIPSYVERADFFWVLAPNAKSMAQSLWFISSAPS
eukprot:3129876-Amphidinium_carterae.1